MRLNREGARRIAGALAVIALMSPQASAQGDLFDSIFGPEQPSAFPSGPSWRPARSRKRPRAPKTSVRYAKPDPVNAEADSMPGGGYCVRACDGYYFPLVKSSSLSGQRTCEYACPSARVQLYQGSSIEQARNVKGERYSALSTAFSFREKLTAGCSCNDPAASRDNYVQLSRRDPTLRSGDIVVGETGALVYSGARLVSVNRASRHVRAQLGQLLPRKAGEARASREGAVALIKTQRRRK